MDIREREPGDVSKLKMLARKERNAKQRDRYRVALLAIEGEQTKGIMRVVARSRAFVQGWAYAYRDGGIGALVPTPQTGRPVILPREKEAQFLARIDAGPKAEDGVCAFTGYDARRILEEEFQAKYTYEGARTLLHRLKYTPLRPRPRHENHDPKAIEQFKTDAPLLSRA
jgi:transposase